MSTKRRGLGSGLDMLLASRLNETKTEAPPEEQLRQLPVDLIQRGRYQPRQEMDETALTELADSIKAQGVIQPIVVRSLGTGDYELIAGERRWRAAQRAGLHTIPAIVKQVTDEETLAMGLIENIQRQNLNPLEEAMSLQRLIDEFGLTHQSVAECVGRSRAAVSNLLRLIALEPEVKNLLQRGELEMGHARALLSLTGLAQSEIARRVVADGLSVRATERLVQRRLVEAQVMSAAVVKKAPSADVEALQQQLSEKLGARVLIKQQERGSGQLVIQYNSLDELDGILAHIG